MNTKNAPILFAVLACAVFASCSREDAVIPPASEPQSPSTTQAVPQKPPAAPIAKENPVWVILTKTDLSDKRTNEFQGIWQPSESDIPHILQEARAHLEKLKKTSSEYERGRIATILSGWDKSACQVVGHVKDGKKLVHLNFFPKDFPKDDEDCSGWQHRYIVVFDGGADFWQIDYDNEAKVFLDFWSNGDA